MNPLVPVSVGTVDSWAPPRLVRFALFDDFNVANVDLATWRLEADGYVTRVAYLMRDNWCWLLQNPPIRVRRGENINIPPGAINLHLEGSRLDGDGPPELVPGGRALPAGDLRQLSRWTS